MGQQALAQPGFEHTTIHHKSSQSRPALLLGQLQLETLRLRGQRQHHRRQVQGLFLAIDEIFDIAALPLSLPERPVSALRLAQQVYALHHQRRRREAPVLHHGLEVATGKLPFDLTQFPTA